jgi:hypothetical protein
MVGVFRRWFVACLVIIGLVSCCNACAALAAHQQPAASSQQPAASSQQPAASSQQPAARRFHYAMPSSLFKLPVLRRCVVAEKCVGINDQYMLGPSLLVAPVTIHNATSRSVCESLLLLLSACNAQICRAEAKRVCTASYRCSDSLVVGVLNVRFFHKQTFRAARTGLITSTTAQRPSRAERRSRSTHRWRRSLSFGASKRRSTGIFRLCSRLL